MADSVSEGIVVQECAGCRSHLFPERLRCPACGSREFRPVRTARGTVREVTGRPGADRAIATVGAAGATVLASVPATAQPGDDIRLTDDPHQVDAAFVPAAGRPYAGDQPRSPQERLASS